MGRVQKVNLIRNFIISLVVGGTVSLAASASQAAPVNYEFASGTTFTLAGPATISGTFTFDNVTNQLSSQNITVGGTSGFASTYNFQYQPWNGATTLGIMAAANSASSNTFAMLLLQFSSALDGSLGLKALSNVAGYNLVNTNYFNPTGLAGGVQVVSAVPLPAALPLYGAGIAVMGFMGWRRKRKTAA